MTAENRQPWSKAPWHLYAVGGFGLLWSAFGTFDYLMTVTRNPAYMGQFPKEMQDYFYGLPWWYYVIWAIGFAGGILGSIVLLARHRWALPLLALSLASTVFSLYCGLLDPNVPKFPGSEIIAVVVTVLAVLVFVYADLMRRRGVLR